VVILEHQSTVNPNLPLRVLMYIARVYEKLTAGRNVYGRKKLLIPRPEFIVLYNGKEPYQPVAFVGFCVALLHKNHDYWADFGVCKV
jgi:hypothetical protein